MLTFVRGEGENRLAVIVNLGNEPVNASAEVGALDLEPWMMSGASVSLAGTEGKLTASLKPYGYAVVELH